MKARNVMGGVIKRSKNKDKVKKLRDNKNA